MDPKKRFFWKIPQDFELLKKVPQNIHQTGQFGWNRYIGIWNLSHGAFLGDVRCTVSSCIVSISNPQCALSQFLRWILQPCFVLKSRPEKKQKNFPSFPLSSKPSSIIVSRFCALLMANSNNCMFTIFIQSEISNVIPNALLRTIQSQSGFNNANISQIIFANITPIGPPEKIQNNNTCNTKSFSR